MTQRHDHRQHEHSALHTRPLPPNRARPGTIGKVRREVGDPVAAPKEPMPYTPPPPVPSGSLVLPLDVVAPEAAAECARSKKLVFHAAGDTGGVHGTSTQEAIAEAMEAQIEAAQGADQPAFFYNLGDVVYFNGQSENYTAQFYEPYQYYPAPIFAIAGNHDGDNHVRPGDQPDTEPSLYGFMMNFCDSAPRPVSPYRQSGTQPYVYWTLDTPVLRVIGLYSNIGGTLDGRGASQQAQWLEQQLASTPQDRRVLVAVHHPPFSLDSVHGGSTDVLTALDRAIEGSRRIPDGVLSGHVHNYQRFSRALGGRKIPYIVAGAGGYPTELRAMHRLQAGLQNERPLPTKLAGVVLEKDNAQDPGFLRITASPDEVTFEYFVVPFAGGPAKLFDSVQSK